MKNTKKLIVTFALAMALASCSLIPDYKAPQVATPAAWKDGSGVGQQAINADWWKNFQSPELNDVMAEALAHNLDLAAAIARIDQSRAQLRITRSTLLPAVDATASAGGEKFNPRSGSSRFTSNSNLGIAAGYELDLFGANRAAVVGSEADLRNSIFSHDALNLVVMGDVASAYFTVLNLKERVALAEKNIGILVAVLKIAQARYDAGSVSLLDVSQQKSALATAQAGLASLKQQQDIQENVLSILLGKAPQNLGLRKTLTGVKVPKIPLSQPAAVITQRPDIKAAEEQLIAANADIGVARAAFFPTINLSAGAGLAFTPIADPASTTLSLAAQLLAPIFHGGALEGGVQLATARQVELAQDYRLTVLTSLQEVNDALMATKTSKLRQDALREAMEQAQKSYELSRGLYEAGSADYQTMLDSERTLIDAEDAYASVRLEVLQAAINLYKALGGGWVDPGKKFVAAMPGTVADNAALPANTVKTTQQTVTVITSPDGRSSKQVTETKTKVEVKKK